MNNQATANDRIIREFECRQLTGICRTTRFLMEKEGKFPQITKNMIASNLIIPFLL